MTTMTMTNHVQHVDNQQKQQDSFGFMATINATAAPKLRCSLPATRRGMTENYTTLHIN